MNSVGVKELGSVRSVHTELQRSDKNGQVEDLGTNKLLGKLEAALRARRDKKLIRMVGGSGNSNSSCAGVPLVDFCSNDYFGLARSAAVEAALDDELARLKASGAHILGSTGSRLLTGDSEYHRQVEEEMRAFYGGESALLFNSGYDLNLGVLACLPQIDDIVLFDELMHNSVREGLRLARGSSRAFKHNDCSDLEQQLQDLTSNSVFKGSIIVAVESVYSMDGHYAPLTEMCDLCDRYGASLVVDEAHSVGVVGPQGRGLVPALELEQRVLYRACTFGKALGAHGAVLIGPSVLREYVVNYCRPFIYSTSLPVHSLAAIRASHQVLLDQGDALQVRLMRLVKRFSDGLTKNKNLRASSLVSPSAIQGMLVPGNDNLVRMCQELQRRGFKVLPIRWPTVPKGLERIRIVLHTHNSDEELDSLLSSLNELCGLQ